MPQHPKYGGRKKGTPNRLTAESREALSDWLNGHFDDFEARLARLDDKDYCVIFRDLWKHCVPGAQNINVDVGGDTRSSIAKTLADMCQKSV